MSIKPIKANVTADEIVAAGSTIELTLRRTGRPAVGTGRDSRGARVRAGRDGHRAR